MKPGIAYAAKLQRYRTLWWAAMNLDRFPFACNRKSSPPDRSGGSPPIAGQIYSVDELPPIELAITQFRDAYTNPGEVRTYPWARIAYNLTKPIVGPKDGLALIPAALPDGWRGEKHSPAILAMCMVVLDIDCGISADECVARLVREGYYGIGHTTHGHLGTISRSPRRSWEEWLGQYPDGTAAEYLMTVKNMRPEIAAGAVLTGFEGKDNRNAVFQHQPCPKYRFYFPLLSPWEASRDLWRHAVLGFADAIGLGASIDGVSAKRQQIFYTPRVLEERLDEFRSFTIAGHLISPDDLERFTAIGARTEVSSRSEIERSRPKHLAEYPPCKWPADFHFDNWARLTAESFRITAALDAAEARGSGAIFSGYVNAGRRHVWCPFEAAHSKESKPEDCFVDDGRAGKRFVVYCLHTHCEGRNSADYVQEWYRQGVLTVADLKDNSVMPFPVLQDPAPAGNGTPSHSYRVPPSAPSRTDSSGIHAVVPTTFTAVELDAMSFPELHWVVHDILPAGLTLLAGKAKIGKSWLAYNIALAVANGDTAFGRYQTGQAEVLYLALEDNRRRLKKRMGIILGADRPAPAGLHFHIEWPRIDDGGLQALDQWLTDHRSVRLVIVDTFGKIRGKPDRDKGIYAQDVADLSVLAKLAHAHNIALVLVHHTRKADASDIFDMVSGSMGMTGTADTNMVLTRARGENGGILALTGRDIENDSDLAMAFDKATGSWTVLGEARQVVGSVTEQKILQVLEIAGEPITRKEIIESTGLTLDSVKSALRRMRQRGLVHPTARGLWKRGIGGAQNFTPIPHSGAGTDKSDPLA